MSQLLRMFLSFVSKDRKFRDSFIIHSASLKREKLIDGSYEDEILPGSQSQDVLEEQLKQADIVLLFISPDFIASDYHYNIEMPLAITMHQEGKARVLPLHCRPVVYEDSPIARLQGLPLTDRATLRPLSIWPDRDEAYSNVVKAIKRVIKELNRQKSARAMTTSQANEPSRIWNVPYTYNPLFTGRDDLLENLHATFAAHRVQRSDFICRQVLNGLGGMGKTQIALEYAHRYQEEYSAVLWVRGDSRENLYADFIHLAHPLNLPERYELDDKVTLPAIKRYLQQKQEKRWLLIFDNLLSQELLQDILPAMGQGDVLVTTQERATGILATAHRVEKMTPDEGIQFLLRRAKILNGNETLDTLSPSQLEQAREIYRLVDGLPLAIDQAGAYIEESGVSLSSYIPLYKNNEAFLLKQRGKFAPDSSLSVTTTFTLYIEKVKQSQPHAWKLLQLCAFFQPDAIPLDLLLAGIPYLQIDPQDNTPPDLLLNQALAALLDLSLLQRNNDTDAGEVVSMHRLVQVVLKEQMGADTQRFWAEQAVEALNAVYPEPDFDYWLQCEAYLPHALLSFESIKQWNLASLAAARLLNRAGSYLYLRARYPQTRLLCERALAIAEGLAGDTQYNAESAVAVETANILYSLGELYRTQKDYALAQNCYERALTLGKRVWRADMPEVARILNGFGELFQARSQFLEAEQYYMQAFSIRKQSLGLDNPDTAASLNNIAGIYDEQGHYEKAIPLYEQALQLRERLLTTAHPATAESLSNVARFYRVIGKYFEARPRFEKSIAASRKAFGPEHPRYAISLNNYAVLCNTLADYTRAEQLLDEALQIRKALFGPKDTSTAGSLNNLAKTYSKQGRYEEAERLYKQAVAVYEDPEKVGREQASTALLLTNLADLYRMQGRYAEAEPLLQEALATCTKRQGSRHPDTALVLHTLGNLYLAQARYVQAESALTEALSIREEKLSKTHPETVLTLKSLADVYAAESRNEQAEQLYQQAYGSAVDVLGAEHPDVVELVEHYAALLRTMGRTEQARALIEGRRGMQPEDSI